MGEGGRWTRYGEELLSLWRRMRGVASAVPEGRSCCYGARPRGELLPLWNRDGMGREDGRRGPSGGG